VDQSPVTFVAEVTLALAVVAALATYLYRFISFCLADLAQAPAVQYLPRQTWRLLILIWIPVGGILYLLYGKVR
jgi:hypothetical protein